MTIHLEMKYDNISKFTRNISNKKMTKTYIYKFISH